MCYCNGYSGLAIADYFVKKALSKGEPITNMHVLKMIYFAQGFGFPVLDRRLIKDDFFAWQWGPVEVNTYKTFCKYGGNPITSISNKTNKELEHIEQNESLITFLDKIYQLRSINPFILSEKTHAAGSPWANTEPYSVIDIELIRNYFMR